MQQAPFENVSPSDRIITLTRGFETIVTGEDYELLRGMGTWYANQTRKDQWYARNSRTDEYLHSVICPAPVALGYVTDHANRNSLDNRRWNLRPLSHWENQYNRGLLRGESGYRGVIVDRRPGRSIRYRARLTNGHGERTDLGSYPDAESAARAYDEAAKALLGPMAILNFPPARETSAYLFEDVPF